MVKPSCGFSARAAAVAGSLLLAPAFVASPIVVAQQGVPSIGAPSGLAQKELDMTFPTLPARALEWTRESASNSPIKVGDRIILKIELSGEDPPAPEVRVAPPPGTKDYVDQGWSFGPPKTVGARTLEIVAIPVKGGASVSLPPLALYDGDKTQPFGRTDPESVGNVQGPNDPNEPPEEMLPPGSLEFPVWVMIVAGLIALVMLVLAGLGVAKLISRYRAKEPPAIAKPDLPEDEVALEALRKLKGEGFAARGKFKEHYFGISEAIKIYIGSRYGFDASESTTHEMITAMEEKKITDTVVDRVETLFGMLDLVKFTDHVPPNDEPDRVLEDARQIVLTTRRPRPVLLQREVGAG